MEELAAVLRAGGNVINNLTINVTENSAEQIINGDNAIVDKRNISIEVPREALHLEARSRMAAAFGDSGACVPYTGPNPWAWRVAEQEQRSSNWQQEYAAQCAKKWDVVDNG